MQTIRYDEAVADEIGLSLLDKSGISANGLRDMMQRMAAQRALPESRQSTYYKTHPDAAKRLSIYQDHINRQTGKTIPISDEINALVNRWKPRCAPLLNRSIRSGTIYDADALPHLCQINCTLPSRRT